MMSKEIEIKPVTRIEGHAKVKIQLDDEGEVSDTKLSVLQLRGFEKFMEGRQVEQAPILSSRVCGVCQEAHHTCSAKATDDVFNVELPEPAEKLRRILHLAGIGQSHILHLYFLALPDLLIPEDAEKRNITGVVEKRPELAKRAIDARKKMKKLVEDIGGREVHPVTFVPGGVSKPLSDQKRRKHLQNMKSILEFAEETVEVFRDLLEENSELIDSLGGVDSYQVGTVNDGYLDFYEGQLRVADKEGEIIDEFDSSKYLDFIEERVNDHSYVKSPYLKEAGFPEGCYRVNSLPRVNVCDAISTDRAQEFLEEFRSDYGKPLKPLLFNYARAIETVYAVEKNIQLLEDEEISKKGNLRADLDLDRAGEGVGVVEAPRGVLIHHYKSDKDGTLSDVNLLVATVQNTPVMERDLDTTARDLITEGDVDEPALNNLEMIIRAYDPCLSCATHSLGVGHPMKVEIVDSEGDILASRGD